MPHEPVREVVVGVGECPAPTPVLELAAAEAALRSAPLTVVHARAGTASRAADEAVRCLRLAHPDLPSQAESLSGEPAAALLARATGASLLVLGRGARRRGRRTALGPVVSAVLGRATTPVLVCAADTAGTAAAEEPRDAARPVVVGVDGTAGSEAAIRFGFEAADLRRAPLTAMHLWPPAAPAGADPGGLSAAEGAFLDLLETWSGKYPDVPLRLAVRHALDAVIVLSAASHSARLLVVAVPPDGRAGRPTGSIVTALAARSACPVAVVPTSA